MTTAAAVEAVDSLEMSSVRVESWAGGNCFPLSCIPSQLFLFLALGLMAELSCLPVGHLPWESEPRQLRGVGEDRRAQFTGHHAPPFTSHFSRGICRPELLVSETEAPFLAFYLLPFFFLLSQVCMHSICHLCGYLRTIGVLLFTYSFSECDTNHSSLRAKGVGRGQLLFVQILYRGL